MEPACPAVDDMAEYRFPSEAGAGGGEEEGGGRVFRAGGDEGAETTETRDDEDELRAETAHVGAAANLGLALFGFCFSKLTRVAS